MKMNLRVCGLLTIIDCGNNSVDVNLKTVLKKLLKLLFQFWEKQ